MEVASADSSIGMTTANAGATRWMAPELFHSEGSEYPPSCASPTPGSVSGYPEERRDSTEVRTVIFYTACSKNGCVLVKASVGGEGTF
jgi:hypothetical protein